MEVAWWLRDTQNFDVENELWFWSLKESEMIGQLGLKSWQIKELNLIIFKV